MRKISILILLSASVATAKTGFHCYAMPGLNAQAFEYGSNNCGSLGSAGAVKSIGKDGRKDILCLYQAWCEPVEGNLIGTEPPDRTPAEIWARFQGGRLKQSALLCKGKGSMAGGILNTSSCPKPSECQRDIFYNYVPSTLSPVIPDRVSTPEQPETRTE